MGCGASVPANAKEGTPPPDSQAYGTRQPRESALEVITSDTTVRTIINVAVRAGASLVGAVGLPGAPLIAEIMSKTLELAEQATENRENCKQLVTLVLACDRALAQVNDKAVFSKCQQELAQLETALARVKDIVEKFGQGRGMLMRVMMAVQDAEEFAASHKQLLEAMTVRGSACAWAHGCMPRMLGLTMAGASNAGDVHASHSPRAAVHTNQP